MTRNSINLLLAGTILGAGALAGAAHAQSTLPGGGRVVAGSATIGAPSGDKLTINQSSNRAVINWNSFSVGQPNTVVFVQPGKTSAVLNRVTGGTSSTIAGEIDANGEVFLVNPNGIALTPTGSVQVGGGFVASTLGITTGDFMAGKLTFAGGGASAAVSNAGSIVVGDHGFAALLGGAAANSGVIAAPLGKVALGSGERATLDLNGDGFLQVALPTGAQSADGQALVSNSGTVDAAGGTVEMRAATVATAIRGAVNMSGVIEATSVSGRDGAVVLDGGTGGGVEVSGDIDASGSGAGQRGGAIRITGNTVALDSTAKILASGSAGGGSVEVGGGPHGADPGLADAATTYVAEGATIDVSATQAGNGGVVAVWSNGTTEFNGQILATGGPGGGNGGWVETSGEGVLDVGPTASVNATGLGKSGTWLLDPQGNVDITNADANNECAASGGVVTCNPTADSSQISANTLTGAIGFAGGNNVVVTTSCPVGSCTGASAGTITVDAAISWTQALSLTLKAASNIVINQAITGTNAGSAVILNAGGTITEAGSGAIQAGKLTTTSVGGATLNGANVIGEFSATNTGSGAVSLNDADASGLLIDKVQSGGGNVTIVNTGALLLNGNIGAGAGTVSLTSTGGSIDDTGAGDTIVAAVLTGSAATGVELSDPNKLGALGSFANTTSGNVFIANGKSLTTTGNIADDASSGTIELLVSGGGALTVDGAVTTTNGQITLVADNTMTFNAGVDAGNARVLLTTASAGVAIDLGTTPGGVLGITQASLSNVTASVLQIGSPTAGKVTITAPITAPAGWSVLTLSNNGAIGQTAALSVPDLRISSVGPVILANAGNDIQVFAAEVASNVRLTDGANLTIGTVDGVVGVSAFSGSSVTLTSSGMIGQNVSAPIDTTGKLTTTSVGGTTLDATNTVGALTAINTGSGDISLTDAVGSGLLIDQVSQSGGGNVTITNTGNLVLVGNIGAGAGTVSLTSTLESIDDAGANNTITAGTLTGSAATGVVLSDPNKIGTLGPFTNTTSGNVMIGNGQSLVTAGAVSNQAPGGTFELIVSGGGALTVGAGSSVTTSNAAITFFADGAMTFDGAVNAGNARVTLATDSAGVPIDIGTTPAGVLGITQASLDEITAAVLQIGSPTAGNLKITAAITAPAGWHVLTLDSAGSISQIAALSVPDLAVLSSGAVSLTNAANDIQTIAAFSTSNVNIADGANLDIGFVDGDAGITGASVKLTSSGTIGQAVGAVISTGGALTTSSVGGTTLNAASNVVSKFNATNSGSGDISLTDTSGPGLSITGVSQSGGGDVTVSNSGAVVLRGAIDAGAGTVSLTSTAGSVSEAAAADTITAGVLTGASATGASFSSANQVATFGGWSDTGAGSSGVTFNDAEALTISGAVASSSGPVTLATTSGNLILAAGATVAGVGVTLSTPAAFVNQAGAGALNAEGGSRWLVYSATPAGDTFDGLNSGDTAIWDATLASLPPANVTLPGDRYLFSQARTLTITTTDLTKNFGQDDTAAVADAYTITGFSPGVAGAFLADTAATALGGAPSVTSAGSPASASVAGSPYAIDATVGSLTSLSGYKLKFVDAGKLTVK